MINLIKTFWREVTGNIVYFVLFAYVAVVAFLIVLRKIFGLCGLL